MPRPQIDARAVRDQIVDIAETLLVESSGQRLVLSDIAVRMGVSQPYIYRHFKNKHALIAELMKRWFDNIEKTGHEICQSGKPWQVKIREHVLETLRLKRAAFDANPELFAAYLNLAKDHQATVSEHTNVLVRQMSQILELGVSENNLEEMVNFTLDATVQFRVPVAILNMPEHATQSRAALVMDAVITFIESRQA